MPDTIIEVLNKLFTEKTIAKAKKNPDDGIYRYLSQFYHRKLVPALKKGTQNEINNWAIIADATKEQASELILRLSTQNSVADLLSIVRFQRALLGKNPYKFFNSFNTSLTISSLSSLNNDDWDFNRSDFSELEQPLIIFLREIERNQAANATFDSDTIYFFGDVTVTNLRSYWVPYSILFEKLKQENDQQLSKTEILEILTATIIEEPDKFQEKVLANHLKLLTTEELIQLFKHQKLSPQNFQSIFEAVFKDKESEPPAFTRKLKKSQLIEILIYQPHAFVCFRQYLQNLDSDEIVNILTRKVEKSYEGYVYDEDCYAEQEFYNALLIAQNNPNFIDSLSSEAFIKILSRLKFSTNQHEGEKNQSAERIFISFISTNHAIDSKEFWHNLLINADSTVIDRILCSPIPSKESNIRLDLKFINIIKTLNSEQLTRILAEKKSNLEISHSNPKYFSTAIPAKTFSVIYPHFELNSFTPNQKARLIVTLAKNMTEQSFSYIINLIDKQANKSYVTDFSIDELMFIMLHLPYQQKKSLHIAKKLFEHYYNSFGKNCLLELCCSNAQLAAALFTHEVSEVKQHIFNSLKIVNFAQIAAKFINQSNRKKLLETGLLGKISYLSSDRTDKISRALSHIFNAENAATDINIFNFVYKNKIFNFAPCVTAEHLIKSFSHRLDVDDDKLKVYLVSEFIAGEINIFSSSKFKHCNELFQIVLNGQKNNYVLPAKVLKNLVIGVFNRGTNFSDDLEKFLPIKSVENDQKCIDNTRYLLILEAHKANNSNLFEQQAITLIDYLAVRINETSKLVHIVINQIHHPYLISFLNDKKIIRLLKSIDIAKIFLFAQQSKLALPLAVKEKLVSRLLKRKGNLAEQLTNFFAEKFQNMKQHPAEFEEKPLILLTTDQVKFGIEERFEVEQAAGLQIHLEKAEAELLIEIHQQTYQKNDVKYQQLITYLDENSLSRLVKHQTKNPQLIKLFEDHLLLRKLTPEIAQTLFITTPALPDFISKILAKYITDNIPELSSFKDFLDSSRFANNPKARAAFLLAVFMRWRSDSSSNQFQKLKNYFTEHPNELATVLSYGINQSDFNFDSAHLLCLVQTPEIMESLTIGKDHTLLRQAFLNIVNSQLNANNQMSIATALIPRLSQKDILQIFIDAQKQDDAFNKDIKKMLVARLNFKQLRKLVAKFEEVSSKKMKLALDDICAAQIERQKDFSIPAFILSLVYAILYYATVGLALHFLAPVTKPDRVYKFLRSIFQPIEVARIKRRAFEQKQHLAEIADEQLASFSAKENGEAILMNNFVAPPNNQQAENLFDPDTGEMRPLFIESKSYTHLFPGEKERLTLKADFIAKEINKQETQGATFWQPMDKRCYFIGEDKHLLTLPNEQKETLSQMIEESKINSRADYNPGKKLTL